MCYFYYKTPKLKSRYIFRFVSFCWLNPGRPMGSVWPQTMFQVCVKFSFFNLETWGSVTFPKIHLVINMPKIRHIEWIDYFIQIFCEGICLFETPISFPSRWGQSDPRVIIAIYCNRNTLDSWNTSAQVTCVYLELFPLASVCLRYCFPANHLTYINCTGHIH